jgi:pyridoxal/pyridoxine/pyridoxamine kinase
MKKRKLYRDGLEETIVGSILVKVTSDGHTIECYKTMDGRRRYFVTLSGSHFCAHGDTIAQAVADALWKDPTKRPSMNVLIQEIKSVGESRKITLNEFRLLTGACLTGCREALRNAGRDESPMTAFEIRDLVSKEWGNKLISVIGFKEKSS